MTKEEKIIDFVKEKLKTNKRMRWYFHRLKYNLFYKFGRKYKYCFDCLMNYKLITTEYKRCSKCADKFRFGRQG